MQQIRILKNVGSYKIDQRLTVANYVARGMIAAGIAAQDDVPVELPVEATKDEPETVHTDGKRKRHYRRRELADDE